MLPNPDTVASPFHTLGRHYEEIDHHGGSFGRPYIVNCGNGGVQYTLQGRPPAPPSSARYGGLIHGPGPGS